ADLEADGALYGPQMAESPELEVVLDINQRLAGLVEVVSAVNGVVDRLEDRDQCRLHHPWSAYVTLQHLTRNIQPAPREECQETVIDRRFIQQLRQHRERPLVGGENLEHVLVLVAE